MAQLIDARFAHDFVMKSYAAVNAHDAAAIAALCTNDVVWDDPAATAPLHSRNAVVLNMLDLARQAGAAPKSGSWGDRCGVKLQHIAAGRIRRRAKQ